jgi:hypothetical protein
MFLLAVLFLAIGGTFQRATVVQMDLADCATPQHSILAALSGTPEVAERNGCAEYVIASQTVIFRVQARKSEVLMVPGEVVSYRAGKGRLYLRRDDNQGELESTVLCMRSMHAPGDACGMKTDDEPTAKHPVRARIP